MDNKKVENKKQMSNKKKFWVGMSALAAVGAITATVAWFTASKDFSPEYTATGYSVSFQDVFDPDNNRNLHPGQTIKEEIGATNNKDNPVLIRVTYGKMEGLAETKNINIKTDIAPLSATIDEDNFERGTDGSYYYKTTLAKGQTATHLKAITLASTFGSSGDMVTETTADTMNGTNWVPKEPGQPGQAGAIGNQYTYSTNDTNFQITAKIETIQATKPDGTSLGELGSAEAVKTAWDQLAPTT